MAAQSTAPGRHRPAAILVGSTETVTEMAANGSTAHGGSRVKTIRVQVQPARSPGLAVADAVVRLTQTAKRVGALVRVIEGVDGVEYVNVDFGAESPASLWAAVRAELQAVPGLAGAAIVCCEGQRGWDDYLLLHHFDPTVPLDLLG
jgi:hypothetical protein